MAFIQKPAYFVAERQIENPQAADQIEHYHL
jgi:hypothetical protein